MAAQVIDHPAHPYTRALVDVMPKPGSRHRPRALLTGEPPNPPTTRFAGCRFAPRCPLFAALGAPQRCTTEPPPALHSISAEHTVACHFWTPQFIQPEGEAQMTVSREETIALLDSLVRIDSVTPWLIPRWRR